MSNFYSIQALRRYASPWPKGVITLGKGESPDSEKWLIELGQPAALNLSNPDLVKVAQLETQEDVYSFASDLAKCYKKIIIDQITEEQAKLLKEARDRAKQKGGSDPKLEDIVAP